MFSMAGHLVPGLYLFEHGLFYRADLNGKGAPCMKPAAFRRINGAWHIPDKTILLDTLRSVDRIPRPSNFPDPT